MASPTTASAELAPLVATPFVVGGPPVPDGPTGVLDPVGRIEVVLLGGLGTPVPPPGPLGVGWQ